MNGLRATKRINGNQVLLSNNQPLKVVSIGLVRINTHGGGENPIGCELCSQLMRNLLSLMMLDRNDLCWKCEKVTLKESNGALVVMEGLLNNGLYILQGLPC